MEYRTLGRSGLKVSAIAMGTFSFGGVGAFSRVANQGVAEARRLVDCCIEGGVNLFDTANMYSFGRSEEILGEALGEKRNQVLISSKARMRIG
ncbi:MAG: aldo/keto reductase, partial [Ensifer adhaerens]